METVAVLGSPTLYFEKDEGFDTITVSSRNEQGDYIYKEIMKKRFGIDDCASLKSFTVPVFDSFNAKIKANKPLFDKYNQYLIELAQAAKKKYPDSAIEIRTPQISQETLSDTALITEGYRQARKYLIARQTYASGNILARKYKMQLDSALRAHPFYDGSKIEIRWGYIDEMETSPFVCQVDGEHCPTGFAKLLACQSIEVVVFQPDIVHPFDLRHALQLPC